MPRYKSGWLAVRSTEREDMDNLDLSGKALHKILDGLSVINRLLGNTNATFKTVKSEILTAKRPLTIVDLGGGGGDRFVDKNIFPSSLFGYSSKKAVSFYYFNVLCHIHQ